MTVREWYRLQRAALWARDPSLASDIDHVAVAIVGPSPPSAWTRIGHTYWIESVEAYLERERVFKLVKRDLEAAMDRLLGVTWDEMGLPPREISWTGFKASD